MLRISPTIAIPEHELQWRFVRASGPGGQKVNKTSSAVQLRFDAGSSPSLSDAVRARLLRLAGRRATREGIVVLEAQRFRSQDRNRQDARERLTALIGRAAAAPPRRRPTRPPPRQARQRLAAKRQRSVIKKLRRPPGPED